LYLCVCRRPFEGSDGVLLFVGITTFFVEVQLVFNNHTVLRGRSDSGMGLPEGSLLPLGTGICWCDRLC